MNIADTCFPAEMSNLSKKVKKKQFYYESNDEPIYNPEVTTMVIFSMVTFIKH